MHNEIYFKPDEQCYPEGVNLDLRARLSQQFIGGVLAGKGMESFSREINDSPPLNITPNSIASFCCDLANSIVDQWAERGWLKPGLSWDDQCRRIVEMDKLRQDEAEKVGLNIK